MYKLKGYVFIHKDGKIIPVPVESQVEGYKQAHEFFKNSNLSHYMFLLKEAKE